MPNLPDSMYEYRYERPQAQQVDTCSDCKEPIYEGDMYYDINGKIICEDCLKDYEKIG